MTTYSGRCHCGGIAIEYTSSVAPAETVLRECQCSFCRMHQALAVSDPNGLAVLREAKPGHLHRYRFALGTADFVLCTNCGAYAGAVLESKGSSVGIVNIRLLKDHVEFTADPKPMNYDGEAEEGRVARRLEKWMPMTVKQMRG